MLHSVPRDRLRSWSCLPNISIKAFHVAKKNGMHITFVWVTPSGKVDRFRIKRFKQARVIPTPTPQIVTSIT